MQPTVDRRAVSTPPGPLQPDRLFHGFLEAAPDAVVIVDGDGIIVQVNSQTEKLFGYRRQEILGSPVEVLMPERFRGGHVAVRHMFTIGNPHPRSMGRGLALFGLRKDGQEFPIDVSLSPLPPEAGILIASTIRDMSAQRALEDELHRRTFDLEKADRQKDQFLAAVAHEFRSPLAVLTNLAHILRSPLAGAAVQQKALDALGRQTAHMSRLVEDLLDVSRVSRGEVSLRHETVDLDLVFSRAVEMSLGLVESRRHHLEVAQFPEPLSVNGDPTRLVQVVSNLLNNAAKYTPEGGNIWLSAAREHDAAAIRIRDNGVGIPQEELSRVFELFSQIESAQGGRIGGLGIGLALVRRLVELHGGAVSVTSDGPGRGSEFVVRLPRPPNDP
jgi:PAS domain S-box-containing protein